MTDKQRSKGKLVRVCQTLPAIVIDCSNMERDRTVPRSRGKLVSQLSARVASDPSAQAAAPQSSRLELVVSIAADLPAIQAWSQINRLLQVMDAAVPALRLVYDAVNSRSENGDLIIALRPADAIGTAATVEVLTKALRRETSDRLQIRGIRLAA